MSKPGTSENVLLSVLSLVTSQNCQILRSRRFQLTRESCFQSRRQTCNGERHGISLISAHPSTRSIPSDWQGGQYVCKEKFRIRWCYTNPFGNISMADLIFRCAIWLDKNGLRDAVSLKVGATLTLSSLPCLFIHLHWSLWASPRIS